MDRPLPMFTQAREARDSSVHYNYQNAVWQAALSGMSDGKTRAVLRGGACAKSTDRRNVSSRSTIRSSSTSIPTYSAADVLTGRIRAQQLAGKDVMIGTGSRHPQR